MARGILWWGWLLLVAAVASGAESALRWDALEKHHKAAPGDALAEFSFRVTNAAAEPVEIRGITTSCRCTVGAMPRQPWLIEPGASDTLNIMVDLRSRRGALTKTVYVDTSVGEEVLMVHVEIPPPPAIQREMNMMAAQADRQAVLRGDCASCHVTPAIGKLGGELFQSACQICHGAEHRASMVPDLMAAPAVRRDGAYWNEWIRNGKEGTLMPAWDRKQGGVLDDAQIESLIAYLLATLPSEPVAK